MLTSTSTKLLAILILTAAIFGAVLLWSFSNQNRLLDRNLAFEKDERVELVSRVVDLSSISLNSFADDYSRWDEMVQFVKTVDLQWAQVNIDASLRSFSADAAWVYDDSTRLVYSVNTFGDSSRSVVPVSSADRSFIINGPRFRYFFVNSRWGIIEVRQAPIQPTIDTLRLTPAKGYLFVGRLWSPTYLERLARYTGSTLGIDTVGMAAVQDSLTNRTDTAVPIHSTLNGLHGEPVACLDSKYAISESHTMETVLRRQAEIVALFLLTVLAMLAVSLYRLVRRPLSLISESLATNRPQILVSLARKFDEFGKLARLVMESVDHKQQLEHEIAERERAESAVRESENFLREVMDGIQDGISVAGRDLKIIRTNKTMEQWYSHRMPLVGRQCYEVYHGTDQFCAECPALQAMETLSPCTHEVPYVSPSGEHRCLELYAHPLIGDTGKAVGVVEYVHDITDRKNADNRVRQQLEFLQTVIDTIPTPVYIKDINLRYTGCNKSFEAFVGKDKSEVVGKSVYDLLNKDTAEKLQQADRELLAEGGKRFYETRLQFLDGTDREVIYYKAAYRDPEGRVAGIAATLIDINERKQVEVALRESEKRYRTLIQSQGEGAATIGIGDRFTFANPAAERIFGADTGQLVGKSVLEYFDGPKFEAFKREILDGPPDSPRTCELRIRRTDDELRDILLTATPQYDDDGHFTGLFGVFRDMTERNRIAEERSKFMSVIDGAPEAIVVLDAAGTIVYVNRAFATITGVAADQAVGRYFEALVRRIYANKLYSIPWDRLKQGESCTDTVAYKGEDGLFRVMDQTISPIGSSFGEVANYVLFIRDVTEERELEIRARWADERLRLSIDGMVDGLTLWDARMTQDGDVDEFLCSEANPAALIILGKERPDVVGRNVRHLMEGVQDYDLHDLFLRVHERGKPVIIEHLHFVRGDSKTVLSIHVWAVGTGVACHLRDITQQLELESQLRQAQKLEAVGSLAAGIAHEINTPIQFVGDNIRFLADSFTSIIDLLDHYRECREKISSEVGERDEMAQLKSIEERTDVSYLKSEIPQAVEQSLEGVRRVSTIVRAMKDFSHSDEREMVLADVNQMLDTTVTIARNELKYVADVVKELDVDLPQIECFRNDLNQVFLNLLINAAHAIQDKVGDGSQGRGTITVRTKRDGGTVIVSVSDSGCGIPESIRHRIFEHFFTTKQVGRGTGQGLAIARSIVIEKHKGSITFDSRVGEGTTFYVRLPITRQEVAHADS